MYTKFTRSEQGCATIEDLMESIKGRYSSKGTVFLLIDDIDKFIGVLVDFCRVSCLHSFAKYDCHLILPRDSACINATETA